ncbi:membrane protein insertion efficiency factor YidD [Bifidobacterium sp. SO1]|uniref:membrane protein insertion efficiency factor YidD n=1 Tax=Bifidobacterium sp. SO1 TaxID=2809029 RepID=UPI001F0B1CA0|nr:membrane protein insertion efficiency factor YidD [Bifidobacterium sp. SO1]
MHAADGMIRAIRWYQRSISANRPACCKYYPSCSNYAVEALERYGAFRGGLLAVLRLLRCRPWNRGGIDDVPQRYSVFYRFSWSKAHEEPRLTPLAWHDDADEPDHHAQRKEMA